MTQQISDQAVAQKLLQSQIVSQGDLQKALAVQAQLKSQGHNFTLAKVLVQSRMTTPEAIKHAFSSSQPLPSGATAPSPISARFPTQPDLITTAGPGTNSNQQPFISPAQAATIPDLTGSQYLNPDNKATLQLSTKTKSAPGVQRFGRYEVLSKLGQGGMGLVYKARHEVLERIVALKTLSLQAHADPAEALIRFEREAKTMAKLQHAHIVPIYDIGGEGHQAYIAMEYVSGGSVSEIIARDGKVDPQQTLVYALKMSRALEHAHKAEIIHRDLKPANILISEDGEPMIADFGLALINTGNDERLSRSGTVVGTLHYMPPEQLDSKSSGVDQRSDIYSMGATLFEMLTGYAPHNARSSEQLMYEIIFGDEPKFPDHCQDVPDPLKAIVLKCLQRKAEARYQNATELSHDLSACLAGKKTTARLSKKKVQKAKKILKAKATEPKVESAPKKSNVSAPKAIFMGLAAAFGLFFFTVLPLTHMFGDSKPKTLVSAEDNESPSTSESPDKGTTTDKISNPEATKDRVKKEPVSKDPGSKTVETPSKDPENPPKPVKEKLLPETTKKAPAPPSPPLGKKTEQAPPKGKFVEPPRYENPPKTADKPKPWIWIAKSLEDQLAAYIERRKLTLKGKPDTAAEISTYQRLKDESGPVYFNNQYDYFRVAYKIKLGLRFYDYQFANKHLAIMERAIQKEELPALLMPAYKTLKIEWIALMIELESQFPTSLKNFAYSGPAEKRRLIEDLNKERSRNLIGIGYNHLENSKGFLLFIPGLIVVHQYFKAMVNKDESAYREALKRNLALTKRTDSHRIYFQVLSCMMTRGKSLKLPTLIDYMNKAIALEKTPPALALRGHYFSLGSKAQRKLAFEDFKEAIARAPRLAQAYRFRFYLHLRTRHKREALADLKIYRSLVPEDLWGQAMQEAFESHRW
ncbi:MAG: protein kinase [Planctomycetota bacterium]|nr:protein kinase [Planctomycetota bacterium]